VASTARIGRRGKKLIVSRVRITPLGDRPQAETTVPKGQKGDSSPSCELSLEGSWITMGSAHVPSKGGGPASGSEAKGTVAGQAREMIDEKKG